MTLNRQSNILAWLAVIALIVIIIVTRLSIAAVNSQTEQISMAENTVKGVTNFRFLIMETVFYNESRSIEQWRHRVGSFSAMLSAQRYSEENENAILLKEKNNLKVLIQLYERLVKTKAASSLPSDLLNHVNEELTASTVSALFLTTQDMLDDAFELIRLNRIDLVTAQERATRIIQASIAVLAALIAIGCFIIKRRVLIPVDALKQGTERVAKGDLAFRLNLPFANEIGTLATMFDHMTVELKQSRDATQSTVRMLADKTQELTRIQQQLQTIIDQMPALVGSWDANFCNRFGNLAYVEWFDISPEQMRGKHMRDIIGHERFEQLEPYLLSVLQGNREVFERTIEFANGKKRHTVFSYVPDIENGVIKGFYGFVSDVTQLKEAQIAKEKVLAQLQGIVDAAKDFAIIEGDENGLITLFSRGAEILLGYEAEEIVGKTDAGIFHVREEIITRGKELTAQLGRPIRGFDAFVEMARQGESESREWTYVRKDGTTLPVNLTVTAIRDSQGMITGYLGIAKDIREDKQILQTLAETRDKAQAANLSKSQFLANMSHEIRTPMNAILGMLQLLQHTDLTSRQLDYAVKTQSAAQSLLGLLNDILDFSKVEADKLTLEHVPFRFDTLMRDLSVIFSSNIGNKDIEVLFSIDHRLPDCVFGDTLRLKQVLINLAGNAIKFTRHGEVVMSLQVLSQESDRTEILFSVRDTGIGIATEQLAYIFEGFSQAEASTSRRFGGTGLGLAISQRLVALMGGELLVESNWGIGSHFYFTLMFEHAKESEDSSSPLLEKIEQLKKLENADTHLESKQKRVLIVDDNDSARDVLLSLVQSFGWQGDAAASGDEALTMLRESELGQFPYDVVFMDWKMPGMDGWEATRQIRQLPHGKHAPVIIMVTAHGREFLTDRVDSELNLLNGFLVKPVTASILFDAVNESLHEPMRIVAKQVEKRLAGLRLLVVEDTVINQQVAQELLSIEGAHVEVADDGAKGVEKVLATRPLFDAVLMDIQMPGMDGYAATGKIRQDSRMQSLPIIAMTANAMASDKAACKAAGMNDHISKPIDINEVVKTILRHCSPGNLTLNNTVSEIATPLPDNSTIELETALKRLGGNKPLFINLARRFGNDVGLMIVNLRQYLKQEDRVSAADVMHTLKGVAGTVGATALAKYAQDLEVQLKAIQATIHGDEIMIELERLTTQADVALKAIALELQPMVPLPPAKIQSTDTYSLGLALDELDVLLRASNMQALGLFATIEKRYGDELGEQLSSLSHAMNRLDFKLALECSHELRERQQ